MITATAVRRAPDSTLRPEFRALLDAAHAAWTTLDRLAAGDPRHSAALGEWTATCLRLVTAISTPAEAAALDGLDGRSADDWIRHLLSFGLDD